MPLPELDALVRHLEAMILAQVFLVQDLAKARRDHG
jgi:hypothetical protein